MFATGEAGALWSWRHAEVLFHRLKTRHRDFRQYEEELTCSTPTDALIWKFNEEFDQREHNLFVPANIDENMIRDNGMFRGDGLTSHSYHYQSDGSIAEAVSFLALVELWQQEPIVRKLYRETSNEDTVPSRVSDPFVDAYLHYGEGEATAEDELIQKIRLHFGYGSRAALDARASQNEVLPEGTVLSASFWDGHTEVMRSRVCEALRDGKPGSLRTSENGGHVVLNWDAPGYQADSVTGYQVLRSVSGAAPDVHVDDTGTTDTAWTDENPPAGDPIYVVRAIYDDYYLGPASVPTNIRATGAPGIVGTVQAGSTLMADTSGIGDANGLTTVSYSYRWISHDGTSDSHIANAAGSTYTLVAADEGETIKVKVSFTDDAGHDETLTSEATDPVAPLPNSPATGAPAITGTVQVGETLTVDTSDIGDDDGLTTVSYSYQWISNDGTSDSDIANAAGSTRTLVAADGGKTIKVKVSFTDDAGHDETLTSEATDPVAPLPNSPATGAPAISGTIRAGEILTASTSGIEDADGMDNVTYSYQWLADDTDIAGATSASYTLTASEEGNAIKVRVSFTDDAGHSETLTSPPLDPSRPYGLTTVVSDGAVVLTWNPPVGFQFLYDYQILRYRPELGETEPIVYVDTGTAETTYSDTDVVPGALYVYRVKAANYFNSLSQASEPVEIRTPESLTSAVTDPVASPPTTLTASIHDAPESHDGENSFTFELRFSETPEPDFSYEALRDHALTASGGTVNKARRLDPLGNVRWEITVEPSSDADVTIVLPETADCDAQGAICTEDGRMLSAEVTLTVAGPEEEEEQTPPENNPATGAPTISGTAQVGQTLTADVTGIADEDGLDNVSYAYQWLADDADIAGATGATHTLTSSEQGKAIKVRVSFTDDEGNDESLTSAATDAAAPPPTPLTASIHDAPESHDGENSFTFELRFSEEPDPAFRYEVLRDQALTASGGTVTKARRLDPPGNVRWEITVEPSSDADVTIVLAETADCDDQGAICTEDGRMLSAEVTLTVAGPEEEEEQTPPENNPATGVPTISGTAQVGQTLPADVTGIADEDGLDNVSYAYQWLADDADIAGATGATHTLTSSEQGKAIKVRVSFTDDEGNDESLTSAATDAAAPPPTPLTASIHDAPESHDGENSFTFELRFSEEPHPAFRYEVLRDQALTASGGTVTNARRLDPPGNVRWEITVEPSSDADVTIVLPVTTDCADQGAICTGDGKMLSAEAALTIAGPEEEEEQTPPENNPATGAPAISGTPQVGETLTAEVTGIADEDGLDNVSYAYQWLADDVNISGATSARYTLTVSEEGKAIKVRVSFTDDEGNDESLTSAATDAAAPPPTPLTASIHDAPESHDGENSFTFELRFSEEPDPAFRYEVLRDQALTASGGTVTNARRLDPPGNVRWEITVEPSSDADVTIVLAETADCDDQRAICTADGRMLSAEVTLTVAGPVEEEEQTSPQNNPATGTPTISGTAQVGQTLAADTDGIADADGLDNATYSYQWLADDVDISGATSSRYKLTDSEEGKPIKVTVSFTDDAGNEESLTSVATAAVGTALTAEFLDTPSSHGGQTAFTFELRLSEEPVSSFSHETLRDQAFTASGGTVTNVRRLDPPGNVRWEITVEPSSDADVTIVLPVTTDCAGQGAICTEDGRMLSPEVTLVVAGFSLDDFDAGDDQAVLASALIRVGDRGRKNNETQDRAWYASETSAWHASGQLRDGSLAWNGMTLNRVVYFSDTGSFRFNEADDIHIGESFSAGGVNRELTVWIQTQTEAVSFLAKDNIRNSASGYITFEAPTAIRSVLEGVSEGDLVIIAVSDPANS